MQFQRVLGLVLLVLIASGETAFAGKNRAQARTAPPPDAGQQPSTDSFIHGTVAGVQNGVITLMIGSNAPNEIRVDAAGAEVVQENGASGDLSLLRRGDSVQIALRQPAHGANRTALRVRIAPIPLLVLSGEVEDVDLNAGTITVLGVRVHVTQETTFSGSVDGAPLRGLGDVRRGQPVSVSVGESPKPAIFPEPPTQYRALWIKQHAGSGDGDTPVRKP